MAQNCSAKLINNVMVGNNDLDRIFFAHSSYLGIHTTRIESKTFSQFIWVVECKVSFESMRIRKNNVADGMIYIENTDGKMANTCKENCDSFMTSAFTITYTYLGISITLLKLQISNYMESWITGFSTTNHSLKPKSLPFKFKFIGCLII